MTETETEVKSPEIIQMTDLRGDTHFHIKLQKESDGKFSGSWDSELEPDEVIEWITQHLPGFEYLVVTDHLEKFDTDESRLPPTGHKYGVEFHYDQVELVSAELARVKGINERHPEFKLISGLEASIRWDGSIDASARMLDMFDVVVASDHHYPISSSSESSEVVTQDPRDLTQRFVTAISNPGVDIIGHIGRKYQDWEQLTWDEIARAAVKFDKALEVNMANTVQLGEGTKQFEPATKNLEPVRDPKVLKILASHGVKISIGSDVHKFKPLVDKEARGIGQLYGYQKLMRDLNEAGYKRSQIINTYTADELVAWAKSHNK